MNLYNYFIFAKICFVLTSNAQRWPMHCFLSWCINAIGFFHSSECTHLLFVQFVSYYALQNELDFEEI